MVMISDRKKPIFDGVCYTCDLDWASEYVISQMLEYFDKQDVHPTIFITHPSPCVMEYVRQGRIDIGLHPNFILPSSQGNSIDEIVAYCMNLWPEAKVFRCHRWYASNDIYDLLYQKGLRYDSNICSWMEVVAPFQHRSGMISIPVFFEDGAWLYHGMSLEFTEHAALFEQPGLKVINIHPMHFVLNTPYFRYMRDIKDRLPRENWNSLNRNEILSLKNTSQIGMQDFLQRMIDCYQVRGVKQYTLQEVYHEIKRTADGYGSDKND